MKSLRCLYIAVGGVAVESIDLVLSPFNAVLSFGLRLRGMDSRSDVNCPFHISLLRQPLQSRTRGFKKQNEDHTADTNRNHSPSHRQLQADPTLASAPHREFA